MKKILSVLSAAAVLASVSAHAQIINVQFASYQNSGSTYAGTGADPLDVGTTWNFVTGTTVSALNTSTGVATSDSLSLASVGFSNGGAGHTDNLFAGYLYAAGTPAITIQTGLDNQAFSLYF